MNIAGYPGDKDNGTTMWWIANTITGVSEFSIQYQIDTFGGRSGAPVFMVIDGDRVGVGVHTYGTVSGNSATRLTNDVLTNVNGWKAEVACVDMQAEITGIVRKPDGTPAAGAVVALGGSSPRHPDIGLVTDADGRNRFKGLTPGVYTVLADAAGHSQGAAEVEAQPGEPTDLDVRLGPG